MRIDELRRAVGMSQQKFANYFGIPVGTLRNWEQGIAKPPEYVFTMIFRSVRRDKMINVETIKFIKMLDDLATKSENGIENFNNATSETLCKKVFYDEKSDFKVVSDACVIDDEDCYHYDIIDYYENNEYIIHIEFDVDTDEPYLIVKLLGSDEEIIIEDGKWFFV